jgi:hypothetical protein
MVGEFETDAPLRKRPPERVIFRKDRRKDQKDQEISSAGLEPATIPVAVSTAAAATTAAALPPPPTPAALFRLIATLAIDGTISAGLKRHSRGLPTACTDHRTACT